MNLRRLLGALAILLAVVIVVWLAVRNPSPLRDSSAVLAHVRQLNQLVSVRYTLQKVVGLKEPGYWIGEDSILLVLQANVDAGIDLSKLTPEQVQIDGRIITVRLPPPEIINVAVDEKATQV
ncbi:MAG TPA: DUF4230 domain-containing protein, partial [Bryobacteraceae bacterium]|nr:DUF4230 domain-containing protein [Bryobacteraceae bacterium]